MKRVTLEDLSAHLNLSKFSVSRALSGKGGVSERTRTLVFEAARALGYDHPAMDGPAADAPRKVALLIPRVDAVSSQFWANTVAGAEDEAVKIGYELSTYLIGEDKPAKVPLRSVHGLILAGRRSRGLTDPYLDSGLPLTLIGHPYPLEHIDSVRASSWASGYLMGSHLAGLGHARIAYVTDVPEDRARQERLRGLRDALSGVEKASVTSHFYDPETDAVDTLRTIFSGASTPTAIFGTTDLVALTMAWALTEMGLKIPQHVSVAGCNNYEVAQKIGIRLTTVQYPMREVGAAAIHMLDWRLEHAGENEPTRQLLLQPELIRRESTARPASAVALRKALAGSDMAPAG